MDHMQNLSGEQLYKKVDKTLQKAIVLDKKKKLWGISELENKKLNESILDYTRYYFKLIDDVFVNYIEPFLFTDKIINLKQEILFKSGWEGNLLFEDNEINEFIKKADNLKEIKILLQMLKTEELKMTLQFEKSEYGLEIMDLFSELNNSKDEDCVIKYIRLRYNIMIKLLD